ncbi:MAG TPA: acetolactate synthase small subunit [Acidobacteriota bacterium]|nr:acetolactate synthase small subunit [Acidobacteriota bacterium]
MRVISEYRDPRQSPLQTLVLHVEDKPGVLDRVASVFRRRAFNIASLSVGHTHRPGISRMTVVMEGGAAEAERAEANLHKLINVLSVDNVTERPSLERHLALVKVRCNPANRREILQLCEVFRARVVDIGPQALVAEITGSDSKIEGLVEVLRPFGILEMARTGAVAMSRGKQASEQGSRPGSGTASENEGSTETSNRAAVRDRISPPVIERVSLLSEDGRSLTAAR